jgi:hypothetical protein
VIKTRNSLLKQEIIDIHNKTASFVDPVYELWFKKEIL